MIFSDNYHIGTMICNFGVLENLNNLESIINLFNISVIEVIENQINDRILYFSLISNKNMNFIDYIKKKNSKNSTVINNTIKNIIKAKLEKFKLDTKTKNQLISKKFTKEILDYNIPNINFSKQMVFKKSFGKFLEIAEDLADGEIIYKI